MSLIRNKTVAVWIAAITLALGAGAAPSSAVTDGAPSVQVSCKYAKIGGKRKCIAAGQFCARRYESDYNRYGYTCSKRDKNGRYHLKKQ